MTIARIVRTLCVGLCLIAPGLSRADSVLPLLPLTTPLDNLFDPLRKVVLREALTGRVLSVTAAGAVVVEYTGPLHAAVVNPASGEIAEVPGPVVGAVLKLRVRFFPGMTREDYPEIFLNQPQPTLRYIYDDLAIQLTDGSVLRPLLDHPATLLKETNIPMLGRLMIEYGPVPGQPAVLRLRDIGCAGVGETARRGYFAGTKGALCRNGTFSFPLNAALPFPTTPAALQGYLMGLIGQTVHAESDIIITTHSLLSGFTR